MNIVSTEIVKAKPERLNLETIDASLKTVEMHWTEIDDELELRGIGRKDTPFTATVSMRMMSAFQLFRYSARAADPAIFKRKH